MEQPAEEELKLIARWLSEEGLAPDSPKEAQLCLLWRALQRTRDRLSSVSWDMDTQRSQHLAEMAEVRKSLEQIRIFTEHKDVLAQEIQDENDQLQDQLQRLISLQDSQISEVAKMLYQQGLTELIHSSPSEQVAYLLVERASLLETSEVPDSLTVDVNTSSQVGTEAQALNTSEHQAEARHLASQASSVERECSRLERDVEEGSRRLAMAHNEIRRLTDELESAHLTQRAYEPELQAAQQEVEQLRQEVDKLKKYEMVELRKTKELNDRLDLEIRALRNRVRFLDAEKNSLQQTVVFLKEKLEQLEKASQEQQAEQQLLPVQVVSLQKEVERLKSALQEQQQLAEQELLTLQVQANQANESAKSQAAQLIQSNEICRDLEKNLSEQSRSLLEKESEIHSLTQQLHNSQEDLDNLISTICTKENNLQDQKNRKQKEVDSQHCENTYCLLEDKGLQTQLQLLQNKANTVPKECPNCQEMLHTVLETQVKYETLKMEICETLKSLDKERSKYHELKEKHKAKLCRAKQKFDDETSWRDEKIKNLERELSLSSHSLAKEKELYMSITVENDKLLVERRRLLEQLNEEEHNKKDSNLTATLSKCRVDFLEMENKKLGNKILHMSSQQAILERSLQNMQSFHFAEELKKISNPTQVLTSLHLPASSMMIPELPEIAVELDKTQLKQSNVTSPPQCLISGPLSRSAEMGYLNLTSARRRSNHSSPPATLSSSHSACC
ncbi:coiled-coil domain-containing protein 30 isoform X3 [Acanthopagrus latus]|uniref:coiled-coil domain-containing protein 30 isoform X3 n=1 Tax=Acanthopagrus latus TaxID=8177 RepID=UPI00187BD2EE|nr:coiled-coil domain-containing protein 30 isoform X3 [Acanthopagrus latus]